MTLTRKIAANTSVQLFGKMVSTLLGLVAVAIMTRSLGAEQFGAYATAVGFLQFIGILSDFGFTVTTANLLSEPKFEKEKILGTTFTWRLLTAVLFQGLAPLIFLFFPYSAAVKWAVAILSLSFFAQALIQVFVAYYQTRLKMHIQTIGEVLGRIVLVGGLILVAWQHGGFLWMMGIITLASLVYTGYLWIKCGRIKMRLDREISSALFQKMWPTALAVIFNSFYLQGDRVILPLYATATQVGFYGASYRVLDIVTQVAAMIMGLLMPLITFAWSRNLRADFEKNFQRAFDMTALLLIPMVAGTLILATPIMKFVAGEGFAGSGKILAILSVAVLGICFGMVFGHAALAIGRQRQALWVYISDAILSIIGYFIFIPRYGVYGAAGVTIFSEFYAGIFLALLTGYYSKFRPRLVAFIKIIIASAIMSLTLYYVQPLNVILSLLLGMVVYGVMVLSLRVISKQTLREIVRPPKKIV